MAAERGGAPPAIVFDIGGTWFRSGLFIDDELDLVSRRPAANFVNHPDASGEQLHRLLIDYLVQDGSRLAGFLPSDVPPIAAISMGAALNAHTGYIYNSGPLWGRRSREFNILAALHDAAPEIHWNVVNDVTAAATYYASVSRRAIERLAVITVSTGIAARTFDSATQSAPVDRESGLQGEIGHLPIHFSHDGVPMHLSCDCGGQDHLNAFASGRGIERVIDALHAFGALPNARWAESQAAAGFNGGFFESARAGDPTAVSVLASVTRPVAEAIRAMLTIDPRIEQVVMVGGVVQALGSTYLDHLLQHLEQTGLYQVTDRNPSYFRRRLSLGDAGDRACLIGAALAGRQPEPTNGGRAARAKMAGQGQSWVVDAWLPVRYRVVDAYGMFDSPRRMQPDDSTFNISDSPLVVIDANVERLHGRRLRSYFGFTDERPGWSSMSVAETHKSMQSVIEILGALDAANIGRRSSPVVAIGGGTLLDAVGVACSLYRRGVSYVRVPTTLLALVDAGIGAKVSVNYDSSKNRVGTYYPPLATLLDATFLETLPRREISSGCAEILKLAVIKDDFLFGLLESQATLIAREGLSRWPVHKDLIARSIGSMLDELAPNLWEHRLDRLADFGHSFSPTIEMAAMPSLLHGEAVAIDIALSCSISQRRGLLPLADLRRVMNLMRRLVLPQTHPSCTADLLSRALADTILHRGGRQRIPLPLRIGEGAFFDDVSIDEVHAGAEALAVVQ